jgi:hypothetical protein
LPPVSLILVANLSFIKWCTLTCEYLREFAKKFEMILMGYFGAERKLIHEKSRYTVPLKRKRPARLEWHENVLDKLKAESNGTTVGTSMEHIIHVQMYIFFSFIRKRQ